MSGLSHHPGPQRAKLSLAATAFVLFTAPLAWFAQFCAGVALTDWPCFPTDNRLAAPLGGLGWTRIGAVLVSTAAIAVALAALSVAWRAYRDVRQDHEGDAGHPDGEIGNERTHFVALWGVCLSSGFALATLLNLVGFLVVPRCAG